MKSSLTFSDYQDASYTKLNPHETIRDEQLNWLIGLSEEVGEVHNVFKHHFWGGEELNREEVVKEVGDILWYAAALCAVCDLDFGTVAEINMRKLQHRFQGSSDFDAEASSQRHEKEKKFSETEEYKKLLSNLPRG